MRQLRYSPTEYENDDEGRRRLQGTVVLIDGHPCRVQDVVNGNVRYLPVDQLNTFMGEVYPSVKLNDPRMNVFSLPTGYINMKHNKRPVAIYTRKRAVRNGFQGIRQGNLLVDFPTYLDTNARYDLSYMALITSPGFVDMMKGTYPTSEEALAQITSTDQMQSIAFHPRLAYVRENDGFPVHIHYRGNRVGWCHGSEVIVPKNKEYMSDILKEAKVLK